MVLVCSAPEIASMLLIITSKHGTLAQQIATFLRKSSGFAENMIIQPLLARSVPQASASGISVTDKLVPFGRMFLCLLHLCLHAYSG